MSTPQPDPATWRVPVERLRTHQALVDRLDIGPGDVLLDLGCGNGFTLATAASRVAEISLIGIELDSDALAAAASWLGESDARCHWFQGDVGDPLPLSDQTVTRVVCHDVLEYLDDPGALLVEAERVMRPGALSVWSHVDYGGIIIGGADRLLTRRITDAYADASYLGLDRSDALMGRRLTSIVDKSPLRRRDVDASVLIATEMAGPAKHRTLDIAATVRRSARRGEVDLSLEDIDGWVSSLVAADEQGEFFYSHTAFLVTAEAGAAAAAPVSGRTSTTS